MSFSHEAATAKKVCKVSNDLAVLLPTDVVERLGLSEGDEVSVIRVETPTARSPEEIDAALAAIRRLRGRVPADYTFNRADAYEDGGY